MGPAAETRQKDSAPVAAQWQARGRPAEAARAYAAKILDGRYVPHVIEPSAGVDRLVLALLSNAYAEDKAPDEKGKEEPRTVMRFHPRIAPFGKIGHAFHQLAHVRLRNPCDAKGY